MTTKVRYEHISHGIAHGHKCDVCGKVIREDPYSGWGLRRVCELPPDHKAHPLGPCPNTCVRRYAHHACAKKIGGHPLFP